MTTEKESIRRGSAANTSDSLPLIGLRLVSIGHPHEFMGDSYIAMTVDIANNSGKTITIVRGRVEFNSLDGSGQKPNLIADGKVNLRPKTTSRVTFRWSALSGDGLGILRQGYLARPFSILFVPLEIGFEDGTKVRANDVFIDNGKP